MHFIWPTAVLVVILQCTSFDGALIRREMGIGQRVSSELFLWTVRSVMCETRDALSDSGLIRFIDSILSLLKDNIRDLRIIYTDLKEVPMILCSLNRLESLDLSYNKINKLPSYCLTQIERLVSFKADNNNISILQADHLRRPSESTIDIIGNKIDFASSILWCFRTHPTWRVNLNLDQSWKQPAHHSWAVASWSEVKHLPDAESY